MPWLSTINFWSFSGLAEDVIPNDVKRNQNEALIEKAGYDELKELILVRTRLPDFAAGLTRIISPDTNPLTSRIIVSINASLLLRDAKIISSNKNGADRAIANGHPSIPPRAKQNIPGAVFNPPLQFMNCAIPNIVVYIAKLDGRKEADAWNIPGLNTIAIKKNRAIRGFSVLFTTRKSIVWLMAHPKARTYRMK